MHKIFTYGTLMRGHGNYGRLRDGNATFLGEAQSEPRFTMLHLGGFPGIVESGSTVIKGELFEVDDDTLQSLDGLEGHPGFYRRTPMSVTLDGGEAVPCEGYVLPSKWLGDGRQVIESGMWTRGGTSPVR